MPEYEFDVAMSFAGEDRDHVRPVVQRLKELGVNVFYDEDRAAELWGVNLVDHLPEIYGKRVRYVLLFASRHYVRKKWTKVERQAAQARALEQAGEYLLPIRLDDTEVPGLPSEVMYLDLRRHSADEIADVFVQKLALSQHKPAFTESALVTAEAATSLLQERPTGWEYLLYIGTVSQGLHDLDGKYRDHLRRYAPRNGIVEHGNGVGLIRDRNVKLSEIIKTTVDTRFTAEVAEDAFGAPGKQGDPLKIVHLGELFVRTFDEILDWAREIHGTSYAHEHARAAAWVQARFADQQLQIMHTFVQDLREVADTLVERLAAGEPINLTVPLVLEVEPALELEFKAALEKLSH